MEIRNVQSTLSGPRLLIPRGDDLVYVPSVIGAHVTGDDLAYDVDIEVELDPDRPRPVVRRLVVTQRAGGPPVAPETLRSVGLGGVARQVVEKASVKMRRNEQGDGWVAEGLDLFAGVEPQDVAAAFKPPRRNKVDPGDVARAANLYREALAAGRRDATEAVAQALDVSRTTASRRIRQARDDGLLGEAPGTKAGER